MLLGIVMLAVTSFGSLMTLVTVSLGEIGDDLGASRATMTWAITGLMLAMAVVTPLAGTLGDVHGHRRVMLAGLVGGAVATVFCGLAWNAPSLIAFRVMFGVCGACVNPSAMSLMMHAFGPDRRASAVGWFQFAVTGAPTIGLVLGGPLIDAFGWRAVFFCFAGVSLIAFLVGLSTLRPMPHQQGRRLDLAGASSLGLGVFAGLLVITTLTSAVRVDGIAGAANPWAFGCAAAAVLAFRRFVHVERTSAHPMIKLEYFGRRNFTMPLVAAAALQFAYMGGFVITPALLEDRYGWAVGSIALLMMPRPGAFSIASLIGGWLPGRVGLRTPIVIGAVCMIASMVAFALASPLTTGTGIAYVVVGLMLSGVSAGISQPAVASSAVGSVDPADMGIANGMSSQTMWIGIIAGIQLMNVLVGDDAFRRPILWHLHGRSRRSRDRLDRGDGRAERIGPERRTVAHNREPFGRPKVVGWSMSMWLMSSWLVPETLRCAPRSQLGPKVLRFWWSRRPTTPWPAATAVTPLERCGSPTRAETT